MGPIKERKHEAALAAQQEERSLQAGLAMLGQKIQELANPNLDASTEGTEGTEGTTSSPTLDLVETSEGQQKAQQEAIDKANEAKEQAKVAEEAQERAKAAEEANDQVALEAARAEALEAANASIAAARAAQEAAAQVPGDEAAQKAANEAVGAAIGAVGSVAKVYLEVAEQAQDEGNLDAAKQKISFAYNLISQAKSGLDLSPEQSEAADAILIKALSLAAQSD